MQWSRISQWSYLYQSIRALLCIIPFHLTLLRYRHNILVTISGRQFHDLCCCQPACCNAAWVQQAGEYARFLLALCILYLHRHVIPAHGHKTICRKYQEIEYSLGIRIFSYSRSKGDCTQGPDYNNYY